MSYSPTVYCASIVTPRLAGGGLRRRRLGGHHDRRFGAPPVLEVRRGLARVRIEVFDEARRGVGVEVLDERPLADVDLPARQERRHGNDDGELLRVAVEVVRHRQDRAVAVPHEDDLRGAVEELRVALGHVEAAERRGPDGSPRRATATGGQGREHCVSSETPRLRKGPVVAAAGQDAVEERRQGRQREERPDRTVRAKETELDERRAEGDEEAEEDAAVARVGRRLRIGDHEEREEEKRAALEPVERDRERLSQPEPSARGGGRRTLRERRASRRRVPRDGRRARRGTRRGSRRTPALPH